MLFGDVAHPVTMNVREIIKVVIFNLIRLPPLDSKEKQPKIFTLKILVKILFSRCKLNYHCRVISDYLEKKKQQ